MLAITAHDADTAHLTLFQVINLSAGYCTHWCTVLLLWWFTSALYLCDILTNYSKHWTRTGKCDWMEKFHRAGIPHQRRKNMMHRLLEKHSHLSVCQSTSFRPVWIIERQIVHCSWAKELAKVLGQVFHILICKHITCCIFTQTSWYMSVVFTILINLTFKVEFYCLNSTEDGIFWVYLSETGYSSSPFLMWFDFTWFYVFFSPCVLILLLLPDSWLLTFPA